MQVVEGLCGNHIVSRHGNLSQAVGSAGSVLQPFPECRVLMSDAV